MSLLDWVSESVEMVRSDGVADGGKRSTEKLLVGGLRRLGRHVPLGTNVFDKDWELLISSWIAQRGLQNRCLRRSEVNSGIYCLFITKSSLYYFLWCEIKTQNRLDSNHLHQTPVIRLRVVTPYFRESHLIGRLLAFLLCYPITV